MLEQRPVFSLTELMDGRFMTDFEKYQTDQFAFRDQWIRFQTAADRLLGKNKSGDVYLGKDQLFEEPSGNPGGNPEESESHRKLQRTLSRGEKLSDAGSRRSFRSRRKDFRHTRRWKIRKNSWKR